MCDPCNATIVVTGRDIGRFRWKKIAFFSFLSLLLLLPILLAGRQKQPVELPVISSPSGDIACCIVTLTGSGPPDTIVYLMLNDSNIGEARVNGQGEWSFETTPLEPGTYTVLAYVVDKEGRRHRATRTIQFTVLPPSQPPEVRLATSDVKPGLVPLVGSAEPGSRIGIELDGDRVGETQADSEGAWEFILKGVHPGTHQVVAWAVDDTLKKHIGSESLEFTIQDQNRAPAITAPEGTLDPATITIQGTGTPGTTVELVRDGVTLTQTRVDENGNWSVQTDVSSYVTTFQAIGYAGEGQEIGRSDVLRLKVPAAAELVAIGDPLITPLQVEDNGMVEARFSWSGRGEPGTRLALEGTAELKQTVDIDDNGNWSISGTIRMAPGTYNLVARMLDPDGLLLDSSDPRQIVITPPPPVSTPDEETQSQSVEVAQGDQQPRESTPTETAAESAADQLQRSLETLLAGKKIEFELSAARLTDKGKQLLDRIADRLLAVPDASVEISGHTDSSGDRQFNQQLSEKRAQAVRQYLISRGIAANRLTAVGYGDSHPLVDNSTLENRKINRRVEFRVQKSGHE